MKKKRILAKQKSKYPSAEFLYTVSVEDYNRIMSNYDRIYDRVNIALGVCSAILLAALNGVDMAVILSWCSYSALEKVAVIIYSLTSMGGAVLFIIATIRFLLLSRSRKLLTFDSNSIKEESLYEESTEDAALWVTLQYIRAINDIRIQIKEKQNSFNTATLLLIIGLLVYVVSLLIYNGGVL